jgi:hypothetical protein
LLENEGVAILTVMVPTGDRPIGLKLLKMKALKFGPQAVQNP